MRLYQLQALLVSRQLGSVSLVFRTTIILLDESAYEPDYLMEASFQAISNGECTKRAGSWRIQESDLCTYDVKKGVCYGDSGGPLILSSKTSQNHVQVGIVSRPSKISFEPICVKAGVPQVFTRVSSYISWIHDNICKFSKVKPDTCTTIKPSTKRPADKEKIVKSSHPSSPYLSKNSWSIVCSSVRSQV